MEWNVVKSVVVLRRGWLVLRGRMVLGVAWDVVKSVVVLRCGWLVLRGRMVLGGWDAVKSALALTGGQC